jgi:ketosteroid isomerase-like protein
VAESGEIVRTGFEAVSDGDLDALLATLDQDVYWQPLLSRTPGEDAFRDHEGVTEWWRRIHAITPDVAAQIDDLVERGDVVYVEGSLGTASADRPVQQASWVLRLRGGKIERMDVFTDRDEARSAAGLDQ